MQGLFEQVYAADDFLIFKSMMVQRNIDLELQALSLLQKQLGHSPEAYLPDTGDSEQTKPLERSHEEVDDKMLEEILRYSKEEYEQQLLSDAEAEMLLSLAKEESLRLYQVSQQEQQDLADKLERRAAEARAQEFGEQTPESGSDEQLLGGGKAELKSEDEATGIGNSVQLSAPVPETGISTATSEDEARKGAQQERTEESFPALYDPQSHHSLAKQPLPPVKPKAQQEPPRQSPVKPPAEEGKVTPSSAASRSRLSGRDGAPTEEGKVIPSSAASRSRLSGRDGAPAEEGKVTPSTAASRSRLSGRDGGVGVNLSGAEAAQRWLDSARTEVKQDSSGGTQRVLVMHSTCTVASVPITFHYTPQDNVHTDTGTAHVHVRTVRPLVRVRGGTTSSVVPPRTQTGGRTARVQMWVVPVGARVRVHFFLCTLLSESVLMCVSMCIYSKVLSELPIPPPSGELKAANCWGADAWNRNIEVYVPHRSDVKKDTESLAWNNGREPWSYFVGFQG